MDQQFLSRGFLPEHDPCRAFPNDSPLAELDELGSDLPSLLVDPGFRQFARELKLPSWSPPDDPADVLPQLRLYYLRLGFLASAYVNQVGQPPSLVLPANIAVPLCHSCRLLERPPILSYDGYALYNWKRFDPTGPIALRNIDTLQNFVHLYDEHWFILVHVEIEVIAAEILAAIDTVSLSLLDERIDAVDSSRTKAAERETILNDALSTISRAVWRQVAVLRRIPEHMDPAVYFRTFRPYIRFFEHVVYEGVDAEPADYRGETGAQSSIIPALVAFLKIPHRASMLTDHLTDMRNFMPAEHRKLLSEIEALPDPRPRADKEIYNDLLEALATFREVHLGWAYEYIHRRVEDPRGTGGTPFMRWLKQLIDETRAWRKE
jgi:indoleamine 2,3-dioxygenase